ncbi:MAG: hypothetical protein KDD62_12260, partial [Bdellovibrionales bacterium]|nr:hypothetical protein [Bdellovibrionales bacterium]
RTQTNVQSIEEQLVQKQNVLEDLRHRLLQNVGMHVEATQVHTSLSDVNNQFDSFARIENQESYLQLLNYDSSSEQSASPVDPFAVQIHDQNLPLDQELSGAHAESRESSGDGFEAYLPHNLSTTPDHAVRALLREQAILLVKQAVPEGSFNPRQSYQQICLVLENQSLESQDSIVDQALLEDFKQALWNELNQEASRRSYAWRSTQSESLQNYLKTELYNVLTQHEDCVRIHSIQERCEENPDHFLQELLTCSENELTLKYPLFVRNQELKSLLTALRAEAVRVEQITTAHADALFSSNEHVRQRALLLPKLAPYQEYGSIDASTSDRLELQLRSLPRFDGLVSEEQTAALTELRELHRYLNEELLTFQPSATSSALRLSEHNIAAILEAPQYELGALIASPTFSNQIQRARQQRFHIVMQAIEASLGNNPIALNGTDKLLAAPPNNSGWQLLWQPGNSLQLCELTLSRFRYQQDREYFQFNPLELRPQSLEERLLSSNAPFLSQTQLQSAEHALFSTPVQYENVQIIPRGRELGSTHTRRDQQGTLSIIGAQQDLPNLGQLFGAENPLQT